MPKTLPYVSMPQDLVTTREARRDGFLAIALRREKESTPYVEQARALLSKLHSQTKSSEDILGMAELRPVFLLAAGYSVKVQGNMDDDDKKKLLEEFVRTVLRPAGSKLDYETLTWLDGVLDVAPEYVREHSVPLTGRE